MTTSLILETNAALQHEVREFVALLMKRPITEEISMKVKSVSAFAHLEIKNGDWIGLEKRSDEVGTSEKHAWIESLILHYLMNYVLSHDAGRVYPGDATFVLGGVKDDIQRQCEPDVAFVRKENVQSSYTSYSYLAPDLVVEILSKSQSEDDLRTKIAEYIHYGTQEAWLVIPKKECVEVYKPGTDPVIYQKGDTISGSVVLPGFSLSLDMIFKD